ncbi:MAG: glycosyltransferase [Actinomycetes bacterium]
MNGLRQRTWNRKPIRVLHVFHELRHSGGETMMASARNQWLDQKIDCELVAVGESVGDFAPALEACGYRIHHLKPARFALLFGFFVLLLKRRPDVVHIHAERASFWLALEARLLGRRVVQTVHTLFPFEGWLQVERRFQRKFTRFLGVTYVAVGPGVARHEQAKFGNNAEVVLNWVDLERYSPPTATQRSESRRSFNLTDEDFVILTVGNCWPLKNHTLVIEAIALATTPNDVVYLHVGDHSIGTGAAEQRLALDQKLSNRVRFLGTRSDIATLLHAADLFIMPSSYEGAALSAIEALATNTPVLLGDSPGLRDFRSFAGATRFTALNPDAISNAVAEIRQASLSETLNFDGRAVAMNWFDPARGVARYAEMYRGQPQGGRR